MNFRQDFYSWKKNRNYVVVKCNYCHLFEIKYTYRKSQTGAIIDIQFSKTVNLGHIEEGHSLEDIATAKSKSSHDEAWERQAIAARKDGCLHETLWEDPL